MKAKGWVITSAALIAGIRLWMQVRGKTKTPFHEWVVGYGALFVFLALAAEWAPQAAAPLAGTIVVGDFLANGASLFEDISGIVTGAETGSILSAAPFAATTNTASVSTSASGAKTSTGAKGVANAAEGTAGLVLNGPLTL